MRDFNIKTYHHLLDSFQQNGYSFFTFSEYVQDAVQDVPKWLMLRHDVDARPENSMAFARIQADRSIRGTYYFRMVPQSFQEEIILEIASLGHEVGYHYETMDSCKGRVDDAYNEFCMHLERFYKLVPVKTISMHGSPMSPYDNREIWKKYDYRSLGILGEPYFDLDFNEVYYLTDTGRCWDGGRFNVRDKATQDNPVTNQSFLDLSFHKTDDIIRAVDTGNFPDKAMINFHPQRWNEHWGRWTSELVLQNLKNVAKTVIVNRSK
jgi:hypothetical protein